MTGATYTSKLTGIPRRQENDSSGLGKIFFLTFGSKGSLQHDNLREQPRVILEKHCFYSPQGDEGSGWGESLRMCQHGDFQ
jgi:hypothetical protein